MSQPEKAEKPVDKKEPPAKKESSSSKWVWLAFGVILVTTGVLTGFNEQVPRLIRALSGAFTDSIGNFFSMTRLNQAGIFSSLAVIWAFRLIMKKKKDGGEPPAH